MQAEKRSFRQGWNWLGAGLALYRKQPAVLAMLALSFWMLVLLTNIIPLIGPLLGSLLMPILSVGMMNACKQIEAGDKPRFEILFSAFKQSPRVLVALGALYLALTLLILSITTLVDGGTLMAMMTGGQVSSEDLQKGEFLSAAQLALVMMMPVLSAFWYAPTLAAWHETPLSKSLFFSFVAGLRNWSAFLGYGLASMAYGIFFPAMIISLVAAFIDSQALLLALVGAPILLVLVPSFFASFYISYREVFTPSPAKPTAGIVDIEA